LYGARFPNASLELFVAPSFAFFSWRKWRTLMVQRGVTIKGTERGAGLSAPAPRRCSRRSGGGPRFFDDGAALRVKVGVPVAIEQGRDDDKVRSFSFLGFACGR
jgi:hypothetical protein